jgi:hypothetical protein
MQDMGMQVTARDATPPYRSCSPSLAPITTIARFARCFAAAVSRIRLHGYCCSPVCHTSPLMCFEASGRCSAGLRIADSGIVSKPMRLDRCSMPQRCWKRVSSARLHTNHPYLEHAVSLSVHLFSHEHDASKSH